MRTKDESAGKINVRSERQRGLAKQIAIARSRRHGDTSNDDVHAFGTSEVPVPSHRDLREELRRIIAEDAENAANEQGELAQNVISAAAPLRKRSHAKTTMLWFAGLIGIVAFALIRQRAPKA